jgi:hypothetical protein
LLPAFLFELDGSQYVRVIGGLPDFGGAFGEKDWALGFWQSEDGGERGVRDYETNPEGPAPAFDWGDEA